MHMIFEQYDDRLRRLNRHDRTQRNFRTAATSFEEYLDEIEVDPLEVESWMIEEFFSSSTHAASTKQTMFKNLRAAYRYAYQRGLIERVPTAYVQLEKAPDKEPVILSNDELRDIKDRCYDRRQWLMFHLYAYTGLRHSEGRELEWDTVDIPNNTITVVGKGGKLRHVPVHPVLGEILANTERASNFLITGGRNGTALSESGAYKQLAKIAPGRGFHDFRRTVASSLYRNGVQPDTIDRIMGWAPSTVRSRYYQNIADDQLQQAILCLYKDEPI